MSSPKLFACAIAFLMASLWLCLRNNNVLGSIQGPYVKYKTFKESSHLHGNGQSNSSVEAPINKCLHLQPYIMNLPFCKTAWSKYGDPVMVRRFELCRQAVVSRNRVCKRLSYSQFHRKAVQNKNIKNIKGVMIYTGMSTDPKRRVPAFGILPCPVKCTYQPHAVKKSSEVSVSIAMVRRETYPEYYGKADYEAVNTAGEGCFDGNCPPSAFLDPGILTLSYSRFSDIRMTWVNRVDWAKRPMPPRPAKPTTVVFISNCVQWRMDYLFALHHEGIDIHFAGACGDSLRRPIPNCSRSVGYSHQCVMKEMSRHPFAIAFENTILDDYQTEKWNKIWESGAIPVYAGDPLARESKALYPPFIDALDYQGPVELAAYLRRVLASDELWKYYTRQQPAVAFAKTTAIPFLDIDHQFLKAQRSIQGAKVSEKALIELQSNARDAFCKVCQLVQNVAMGRG